MQLMMTKNKANPQRLAETFKALVSIDSVSKQEGLIAQEIMKINRSHGF